MKSWSEPLVLPGPLRDVRLIGAIADANPRPPGADGTEQAAYQRGLRDAEASLREQLAGERTKLDRLQRGLLAALRDAVPQVVHATENAVVTLALEVAQKLVAGLPVSPVLVEAAVREAMALVEDTTELWIDLHPEDLALLQQVESPLLSPQPTGPRLHFQTSSDVSHGGCVVRTRFGVIDARRETKVELLKQSLLR